MARKRETLNNQYKQEKAEGLTTATSFKQWMELQAVKDQVVETHNKVEQPTLQETLKTVEQATQSTIYKADLARKIFDEEYEKAGNKNPKRSVVLARFVKEAGLTKKGAPTYLQTIKKKKGLVTVRA
ncbi:MAG: hypothetical protein ACXW2E_00725 [Nitrososphaeraceae archaeon]